MDQALHRRLLIESLLVTADPELSPPPYRYDEQRQVSVLEDGTPLVEVAGGSGTETMTKATGEHADADDPARVDVWNATMTETAVRAERTDTDAPYSWGDTQLDTRRFPADVEKD